MRRGREALRRMWAGEGGPALALLAVATAPLEVVFGGLVRSRNLLYDRGVLPTEAGPIPVVSVGNLAVGGTGKTPVAAWLVHVLDELGRRPAIVTRGYGEDEILLHRRWNPEAPVIVAARRVRGVREAAARGRHVAVVDDGFQHRSLRRDLDLVLLSPAHPLPPRLLPRGPYREPLRSLRRAHGILVTAKGPDELPRARALLREVRRIPGLPPAELFPFRVGRWRSLQGPPRDAPPGTPLALASVAEPAAFLRLVASRVPGEPELLAFPDHHAYGPPEVERIRTAAAGRWIATTEKDAVKLAPFGELLPAVRVLPLEPAPDPSLRDRLVGRLEGASPGGRTP